MKQKGQSCRQPQGVLVRLTFFLEGVINLNKLG